MRFDKFADEAKIWWTTYLKRVSYHQRRGELRHDNSTLFYPNIMLAVNAGDFYVVELIGAVENFSQLILKKHTSSIYRYLSQL